MNSAYAAPASLTDLLEQLGQGGARPAGGATDLLPRLRNGLLPEGRLVSTRIPELRRVEIGAGGISLGAGLTLRELIDHEGLRECHPVIGRCLSLVGAPQHRNSGTLGGNLCLDTRCSWYNQSLRWRQAVDFCLKYEGEGCHVVPGSGRCHATMSSDGVAVFSALGARIRIQSARGGRILPLLDLYRHNGMDHLELAADELVTHVLLDLPGPGARADYQKLRQRESFDYPLLGLAGVLRLEEQRIAGLRLCFIAVESWPLLLDEEALGIGGLEPAAVDRAQVLARCREACRPLGNSPLSPAWRREMVPVMAGRVLANLGL